MALDGLSVVASLWLAALFRPALNRFEWVMSIPAQSFYPAGFIYLVPPDLGSHLFGAFHL